MKAGVLRAAVQNITCLAEALHNSASKSRHDVSMTFAVGTARRSIEDLNESVNEFTGEMEGLARQAEALAKAARDSLNLL
jgi:cell division protein FtsB